MKINIFPKKLKSFWACTWACAQRLVLDLKALVWFILVLLRLSFDEILILCGVLLKLSPLCLKAYISMLIMSCVRLIDFPHATIASILGYFLLYRVLQSMPSSSRIEVEYCQHTPIVTKFSLLFQLFEESLYFSPRTSINLVR